METTTKALPRDVFMYLLVVITLAMSAVNLGTLLFQYVNLYVPDPTLLVCSGTWCQSAIRWSLASLIVVFPVLVWAWRFLQREVAADPSKGQLRVRRWLLYLTLFVAGGALIGDTVTLIYNWLEGDLTTQFVLKVLVVLYIAGTVFYYFLRALHPEKPGYARQVALVATAVVIASLATGFVASGSPFRVRLEKQDEQRVQNLQMIQGQIVQVYWIAKGKLPDTLDELNDSVSGFVPPVDPVTKQAFEYIRKSDKVFMLCAVFATEQTDTGQMPRAVYDVPGSTWSHAAGRVCFERTIDAQLYPPKLR